MKEIKEMTDVNILLNNKCKNECIGFIYDLYSLNTNFNEI
jgi:hypothetical protein